MLQILTLVLGLVATNTYLIADDSISEAVVIDPAWEGETILAMAQQRSWHIKQIWITHAHFDHFAGVSAILVGCNPSPTVALHAADLPLWRNKGGAEWFGIQIPAVAQPSLLLHAGQTLRVGKYEFEVRHMPGHSPGHVVFYCASENLVFCGDTIFAGGIGRTDLPGGNEETLLESIHRQVLTLPDPTRLMCGHGEETSVGKEKRTNMYLI
jgi:glyoxylase-like metal-dependent hydrolase (beta-lactamase superfamily II)